MSTQRERDQNILETSAIVRDELTQAANQVGMLYADWVNYRADFDGDLATIDTIPGEVKERLHAIVRLARFVADTCAGALDRGIPF